MTPALLECEFTFRCQAPISIENMLQGMQGMQIAEQPQSRDHLSNRSRSINPSKRKRRVLQHADQKLDTKCNTSEARSGGNSTEPDGSPPHRIFIPAGVFIPDPFHEAQAVDLLLRCRGIDYSVHSQVLSKLSDFFKGASEGSFQESLTRIIPLEEEDPNHISALLEFAYTGSYYIRWQHSGDATDARPHWTLMALDHIYIYSLADRLLVPELKSLARSKLKAWFTHRWSSNSLLEILEEIWTTSPSSDRGLRELGVKAARRRMDSLRGDSLAEDDKEERARKEALAIDFAVSLMQAVPDLAAELLVSRGAASSSLPSNGKEGGLPVCIKCSKGDKIVSGCCSLCAFTDEVTMRVIAQPHRKPRASGGTTPAS